MTTLLVQADRLLDNLCTIQKKVGKTALIPVLEGNAYGLGDVQAAGELARSGVGLIAVSRLEEAERILAHVGGVDVLLLSSYATEAEAERIVSAGIIATVGSNDSAVLLSGMARALGKTARVHIRFDLGAAESGFLPEEAAKAAQTVKYLTDITVCGVYAQFHKATSPKRAQLQLTRFMDAISVLRREEISYGVTHIAGSLEAVKFPFARLDAVRVGEELTGRTGDAEKLGLKKIGRLASNVCDVRWVPAKYPLQGGGKTSRASRLATIPVGTADGAFLREKKPAFGGFTCEIGGKRVPIVGRAGYTCVMADVTGIDCKAGDRVYFDVSPAYVNAEMRRDYV